MVTFMNKITSDRHYQQIQPSEKDLDGEETKLPIHNLITSLCKSEGIRGLPSLPWWSKENFKIDKIFSLSSHIKSPGTNHELGYCYTRNFLTSHFIGSGPNKYHVRKSDQDNWTPHLRILSFIIDVEARRWGDFQVIFDELAVTKGKRIETFMAAFLSSWLCTFILPVRDAGCICFGTFSIPSFVALGVGYCLPTATLASVYKGLNEISRSSHSGRAKPFQLEEAQQLISSLRHFRWHSSIINRHKETLLHDGKLLSVDFAYFFSICLSFISYRYEDN
ncbi:hypothetical protein Cgig2_001036 [Carnegiea gigantea]|uniref:Uncharacterized protein n=1 Tax=Carnegiea gigantea TaxID=171969 RepID=A0A9Q1JGX7_9CARY|nr:hypothetical protein Cgig2_001036 [Carnegiea gigantea]